MTDGCIYLVESQRGYWKFPDLQKRVIAAQAHWKADFIAIEKASSGIALLEVLWECYPAEIRRQLLQRIEAVPSKEVRAGKAMVMVEQGKVYFPLEAPWLNDLMVELGAFPAGLNDDQVDALSQAVEFFRNLLKSRYNPNFKGGVRVL